MSKIYVSKSNNPYFNIALENHLMFNHGEDISLYLWQNKSCAIMGRNQNIYSECDIDYLNSYDILPVRRFSGGGAVYHDLGNLNFTFLCNEDAYDNKEFLSIVKNAINYLGINCEFSGRNDVLCNGKKFSGHAYYTEDSKFLYHGTIMVNVDFSKLIKALTPSKLKLESKGIDSVKSRVINLSEIKPDITVEKVINAFESAFKNIFKDTKPTEYIDENDIVIPVEKVIKSKEWIFGESPSFDVQIEKHYDFGNVSVKAKIDNGKITEVKIYSDSLKKLNIEKCENILKNSFFDRNKLLDTIDNCLLN